MELLKLTERTASLLSSCERLQVSPADDGLRKEFEKALAAFVEAEVNAPPIVVGLFNQATALADGVTFRIQQVCPSSTPEELGAVRRAAGNLRTCLVDLHAATLRREAAARPGTVGFTPRTTSVPHLPPRRGQGD